jgi:hypothetical protein
VDQLLVAGTFLLIGSIMAAVGGVAAAWVGHALATRTERSTRFFDEKARAFRQLMASAHEHWWRIREEVEESREASEDSAADPEPIDIEAPVDLWRKQAEIEVLTRDEAIVSTANALVTSVVNMGNAAQGKPRHEFHKTETWEQSQQEFYSARRAFIESVHAYFAEAGYDG